MALKFSTSKITDLTTTVEDLPVQTPNGQIGWAVVRIAYTVEGLAPSVAIHVPIEWVESDTDEQRKSKALRNARQLIDHACNMVVEPAPKPFALEGLSQELGLTAPTTRPQPTVKRTQRGLGSAEKQAGRRGAL